MFALYIVVYCRILFGKTRSAGSPRDELLKSSVSVLGKNAHKFYLNQHWLSKDIGVGRDIAGF